MPTLDNPRHELFCQELALGKTADQAYQNAGFEPNRGNAARLKAKDFIRRRLSEILSSLHARSVKQVNYTREWVTEELIDNVKRAKAAGDISAANNALKLLGSEKQMFVQRSEVGKPGDFSELQSVDDVLNELRKQLGHNGAPLVDALLEALGKSHPESTASTQHTRDTSGQAVDNTNELNTATDTISAGQGDGDDGV